MKMNSRYFKTSDLALATTLSLSFSVDSVERTESRRVLFAFQKSQEIEELVESYWRGDLRVEPQRFFNQLKNIKTRIYSSEVL